MNNQQVLSICIPIYNRSKYLKRQFEQFLQCKELFGGKVQLFISDNCSEDDLGSIAEDYSRKGLIFEYSRNNENIGPDANFIKCFNSAVGKYVWLLGSDDIPVEGFIPKLVDILENHDYDFLFLNHQIDNGELLEYCSASEILEKIHVWITFMSANIFKTEYVRNVCGEKYMGTYLIQVPYFLEGIVAGGTKAIYNYSWIQGGSDSANNGGYNLFQVFCENLLTIIHEKVENGKLSERQFRNIKKSVFCKWMISFYVRFFIKHDYGNFKMDNAKEILHKWYGGEPYYYIAIAKQRLKQFVKFFISKTA